MKFIALDTETGGTHAECSLLSVYVCVLDENLVQLDELDLFIRPNDDLFRVTAEGLGVNGINLVEHAKVALTEGQAAQALYNFLNKHNPDGQDKLIPIGHNVTFDIVRIKETLVSSWDKFVSYRKLDTGSIAQFLKLRGDLPNTTTGSLGSLLEHFGIKPEGMLHSAKTDTLATVELLRRMLKL